MDGMSKFVCVRCDVGFDRLADYERHIQKRWHLKDGVIPASLLWEAMRDRVAQAERVLSDNGWRYQPHSDEWRVEPVCRGSA